MRKLLLLFGFLGFLAGTDLKAQVGGTTTYSFLDLSPSARVTALGGSLITVFDDDVNLAFGNPGLLNPSMHQALSFSHNFHLNSVKHGYATYGQHFDKIGTTFHAGFQYVGYGTFDLTDELGQLLGTFKANDYTVTFGAGRQVAERLHLGANLRFITSQLEGYNSLGIAADLGAVYRDTSGRFLATMVVRNLGAQLTTYTGEGAREPLPLDIQLGISVRLKYLPFRFSAIYHDLQRWNLLYDDPNSVEDPLFIGDGTTGNSAVGDFFDNFFRHFIFSGEFLFGKKEVFRLRFAYNHQRRQEMKVEGFGSLAGFSLGAGIKVKQFRIDFGHAAYHIAGGVNHLTISTNLQEFRR